MRSFDISHSYVLTNGLRLHVAEAGQGPTVILCHGFPQCWYAWRHQIQALAEQGYRVIAPDLRGYGRSDAPDDKNVYTLFHIVGDIIGLFSALDISDAAIVGHDWGAVIAWYAALMRPDLITAVAALSVPYGLRGAISDIQALTMAGMVDHYVLYFQHDGLADQEFESDIGFALIKTLKALSAGDFTPAPWTGFISGEGFLGGLPTNKRNESWLSKSDFDFYVSTYTRSGITPALNWYRNLDLNWQLLAPFQNSRIVQPALFMIGEQDPLKSMFSSAIVALSEQVPNLIRNVEIPNVGHWLPEEAPAVVSKELINFLQANFSIAIKDQFTEARAV